MQICCTKSWLLKVVLRIYRALISQVAIVSPCFMRTPCSRCKSLKKERWKGRKPRRHKRARSQLLGGRELKSLPHYLWYEQQGWVCVIKYDNVRLFQQQRLLQLKISRVNFVLQLLQLQHMNDYSYQKSYVPQGTGISTPMGMTHSMQDSKCSSDMCSSDMEIYMICKESPGLRAERQKGSCSLVLSSKGRTSVFTKHVSYIVYDITLLTV